MFQRERRCFCTLCMHLSHNRVPAFLPRDTFFCTDDSLFGTEDKTLPRLLLLFFSPSKLQVVNSLHSHTRHSAKSLPHTIHFSTLTGFISAGFCNDMWAAISICFLYSVLSTGCILHNKYILSSVAPHEDIMLVAQNVFTILFIVLFGTYHDGSAPPKEFDIRRALKPRYAIYHSAGDLVVGLTYSLSVVTGLWCLFHSTVPTFSAIKKSGMLISWVIEATTKPTNTTWTCLPSLFVVMFGTLLQTWFDLDFSALGILFGVLSCVFQSLSFEIGKKMVTHGKDLWSVLLINSAVSLVVQLVYMCTYGEVHIIGDFVHALMGDTEALAIVTNRKGAMAHMTIGDSLTARATALQLGMHVLGNCCLVMLMNFSIFMNCTVSSPLAHVVTGNVKSIVTTIAGILMFSLHLHNLGYVGITVGFLGGVWFSVVKYREEMRKRAAAADAKLASTAVEVVVETQQPVDSKTRCCEQ